jgi:hypothetical protein
LIDHLRLGLMIVVDQFTDQPHGRPEQLAAGGSDLVAPSRDPLRFPCNRLLLRVVDRGGRPRRP